MGKSEGKGGKGEEDEVKEEEKTRGKTFFHVISCLSFKYCVK